MATATMTPSRMRFDTTFSAGIMRQNPGTIHSDQAMSMADMLPSIDFGFDKLRREMASFRVQFDDFIERGRQRVLEERSLFQTRMADIQKAQLATKRDIEAVKSEAGLHRDCMDREADEIDEIRQAIADVEIQRADQQTRRDEFRNRVAQLQEAVDARRKVQQKQQRHLDEQAAHNGPELRFWEESLGLRIQGLGQTDRLRFVFEIDRTKNKGQARECSFDLDMARGEYDILSTEPVLDRDVLVTLLERLNETRELAPFLKRIRVLFTHALDD